MSWTEHCKKTIDVIKSSEIAVFAKMITIFCAKKLLLAKYSKVEPAIRQINYNKFYTYLNSSYLRPPFEIFESVILYKHHFE